MTIKLAVIMDPIQSILPHKDSTLAMMLEAQRRKWQITYMQTSDLFLRGNEPRAYARGISVKDDHLSWYVLGDQKERSLLDFDLVLMRKDPPFNTEYIYTTYLLDLVAQAGVMVANRPDSLRNTNEKFSISWFPDCCPPFMVTSRHQDIISFLENHGDVVLKPLDGMGGASIFRLKHGDDNTNVIIETLTNQGTRHIMAQRYIPEISKGDKRILLIDGEPIPYALARIPKDGEMRGNLARGATGEAIPLTEREQFICQRLAPTLREMGLYFVGLDVIGDYLTEINVTCPTCIRELDAQCDLNISGKLLDFFESRLR